MGNRREPSTKLTDKLEAAQNRISELEAELAQAREGESRFRRIIENANGIIYALSLDGTLTYVSPAWTRLLGHDPSEVVGKPYTLFVHPESLAACDSYFAQVMAGGADVGNVAYQVRHADLTWRWHVSAGAAVLDAAGHPALFVGIARDVTERRRAEEEIRRLNEGLEMRVAERTAELEAANRELEAFSYSVSHDLRAPLRSIDGFATILQERWVSRLPAEASRLLESIRRSALRMGTLIEALLSFSRLGRQPLRKGRVATAGMVSEVIESLSVQIGARRIEFVVGELPDCEGDAVLLRQVWVNLLSNAVKFTQGRQQARIEVGTREQNGKTVYYVKDNGVGFDMRWSGKLFGVFQRLHSPDRYEGTGIGLANVQRIVSRHGGKVWADAVADAGATFSFNL